MPAHPYRYETLQNLNASKMPAHPYRVGINKRLRAFTAVIVPPLQAALIRHKAVSESLLEFGVALGAND